MKEMDLICKTCIHKNVCAYIAQTARIVTNINVDTKSDNYPSNVVINVSCTDYVEEDSRRK